MEDHVVLTAEPQSRYIGFVLEKSPPKLLPL